MINYRELKQLRSMARKSLPDSCTITRATKTSDSQGGFTTVWATQASNVACKLSEKSAVVATDGGQFVVKSGMYLTLEYDGPIASGDRIEHGGLTYEVISVGNDKSWQVLLRCEVKRID